MWKILNMAPSPEPGELPPVNRAGRQGPQGGMPGAPRIDENLEPMSGIIPKDRFREADRERQKVQITPQQYAGIAPAVPDPAQREFRAPGFGGVVMTDAAARGEPSSLPRGVELAPSRATC